MARPAANLRLFAGIYPPPDHVPPMLDALGALDLPRHRCSRPDQVHLTLHFIGDVPVRLFEETLESFRRAGAGIESFTLTPQRIITLPEHNRPRLIALALEAPPPLLEIQRRLAHRLASAPRRKPGDKYLPHITLCRFAHGTRCPRIDHPVHLPPFPVDEIRLMKSTLRDTGAEHALLDSVSLH